MEAVSKAWLPQITRLLTRPEGRTAVHDSQAACQWLDGPLGVHSETLDYVYPALCVDHVYPPLCVL